MENHSPENNNNPPPSHSDKLYSKGEIPFTERKFESAPKPPQKSLLDELIGAHAQIPKKHEKPPEAPKSILEKKAGGLSRSEFRTELKRVPYEKTGLYEKERLGVEKEMERKTYGENVDIKDVEKHIKSLKKEGFTAPAIKERIEAKHKITLLEKLKEKKK